MNEDDDRFLTIGDRLVGDLERLGNLRPDSSVLDIGCGYGRVAHALRRSGWDGQYLGVDVLPQQIAWCQDNLATERVRFQHLDVANDRYNPDGRLSISEVALDFKSDVTIFSSVFTHMWPEDVEAYLRLSRATLRRGGRVYATFFLMNPEWRQLADQGRPRFPLPYAHTKYCRYMSRENPLHVIAYKERWVQRITEGMGLTIVSRQYGAWSGRKGTGMQDVLIFARQTAPFVRRLLGRGRRSVRALSRSR